MFYFILLSEEKSYLTTQQLKYKSFITNILQFILFIYQILQFLHMLSCTNNLETFEKQVKQPFSKSLPFIVYQFTSLFKHHQYVWAIQAVSFIFYFK